MLLVVLEYNARLPSFGRVATRQHADMETHKCYDELVFGDAQPDLGRTSRTGCLHVHVLHQSPTAKVLHHKSLGTKGGGNRDAASTSVDEAIRQNMSGQLDSWFVGPAEHGFCCATQMVRRTGEGPTIQNNRGGQHHRFGG